PMDPEPAPAPAPRPAPARLEGEEHGRLQSGQWNLDVLGRLVEGYKNILRNIYSPAEYYNRALECLSRFHQNRVEPRQTNMIADLRSLGRLLFTLGIRDSERTAFWNYVYRLVRFHRRDVAHGLTLAAMGYHFRQITAKYCD
ncbi:MAG: DUF4070 domain-containing protein, partial [Pyrinomonadaceae bacterium]